MLPYIAVSLGGSWGGWSRELDLEKGVNKTVFFFLHKSPWNIFAQCCGHKIVYLAHSWRMWMVSPVSCVSIARAATGATSSNTGDKIGDTSAALESQKDA